MQHLDVMFTDSQLQIEHRDAPKQEF